MVSGHGHIEPKDLHAIFRFLFLVSTRQMTGQLIAIEKANPTNSNTHRLAGALTPSIVRVVKCRFQCHGLVVLLELTEY